MIRLPFKMALIASLAIGLATPVFAAKPRSNAAQLKQMVEKAKTACAGDIDKYCKDITPGEGRIISCLDSRADKLTASCAASKREAEEGASKTVDRAAMAFQKSCKSDVEKFCSDVPPGKGRQLECLSGHQDDLSRSCKDFHVELNKKVEEYWSS